MQNSSMHQSGLSSIEEVKQKIDQGHYDTNGWTVYGHRSDSLVYWNNLDQEIYLDEKNSYTWFDTKSKIQYSARSSNTYSANDYLPYRILSLLRYLVFLVGYLLLIWSLFQYCKTLKNTSASILSYSLGSLMLLSLLALIQYDQYFDPLVVVRNINHSFLCSSISSFGLLVAALAGLAFLFHRHKSESNTQWSRKALWGIAGTTLGIGLFSFGYLTNIIVQNQSIHLDIENILLFDKYSFLVIILLLMYMLSIFIIVCTQVLNLRKRYVDKDPKIFFYASAVLTTLVLSILVGHVIPLWALTLYSIIYMLMIDLYSEHKSNSIIWLIWWMVIFSIFVAGVIFYNSLLKDIANRKDMVEQLYQSGTQEDISKIKQLNDTLLSSEIVQTLSQLQFGELSRDDFATYFKDQTSYDQIIDSFNLSIEGYNKQRAPIFNTYGRPYYSLKEDLDNANRLSPFMWYNPFTKCYYLKYTINNDFHELAPFDLVITCSPNTNTTDSDLGNYYVVKQNKIVKSDDSYGAKGELNHIQAVQRDTIISGISYVVNQAEDQLRIINYKKISALIKPISLFSYVFSILGVILILLSLTNSKWQFLNDPFNIKLFNRDSLRTRIQLVIIVLIVFSFLIIGLMTGYYFNNLLKNNQNKHNQQQIIAVINAIQSKLESVADEESAEILLNKSIKEIGDIHNQQLSIYNNQGQLTNYSEDKETMLRLPLSFKAMQSNTKEIVFNGTPRTIVPLRLDSDRPFAYCTISFENNPRSYSSILDFISTILNVYVFLFLLASAIALAIANSITRPLSVIAEKLKSFKVGANNEPLQYDGKDEIGILIDEYNNLIVQVQDSADIIAKTERDMAWREMAKQVAHEIKNPLTPMKLSIQYLDKMVETNPDRARDITKKVATTLVTQIDALTNIANEFSNYATMPRANNTKLVLNEVVEAVHDLFRKRDDMNITMSEPIEDLEVYVDRNQLLRILNNLVKNAIQAIPEDRPGIIQIALQKENNKAIISVKDNGKGIPDYMKQKVFTPNFTTKSSGTGLGLAISANMIDSMNGRIYFETEVDKGTTFFVEIPLTRKDVRLKGGNRVSLDD